MSLVLVTLQEQVEAVNIIKYFKKYLSVVVVYSLVTWALMFKYYRGDDLGFLLCTTLLLIYLYMKTSNELAKYQNGHKWVISHSGNCNCIDCPLTNNTFMIDNK